MLKNEYLLAKIGADTAENERNFAENYKNNELATTVRCWGRRTRHAGSADAARHDGGSPRCVPLAGRAPGEAREESAGGGTSGLRTDACCRKAA